MYSDCVPGEKGRGGGVIPYIGVLGVCGAQSFLV